MNVIFLSSNRCITLLSIKLSRQLFQSSQVNSESNSLGIVVSFHTDSQSWEPHRELMQTLELKNNFIAYKRVYFLS